MKHSEIHKLNGWNRVNKILSNLKEIDAYENKFNCKYFLKKSKNEKDELECY